MGNGKRRLRSLTLNLWRGSIARRATGRTEDATRWVMTTAIELSAQEGPR